MINFFKDLVYGDMPDKSSTGGNYNDQKSAQIATCALFIEVANSDEEFTDDEKKLIYNLMRKQFNLSEDELKELIKQSQEEIKESVSLYEFTDVINHNFSDSEKYSILKNLWKLILIDGKLDSHEEFFVRRISGNLHLEHQDLIAAKMEVKKEMGIE